MGPLQRIRRTLLLRKFLRSKDAPPLPLPESTGGDPDVVLGPGDDPRAGLESIGPEVDADGNSYVEPGDERVPGGEGRSGLTGWMERRASRVVSKIYDSRADDLEVRAKRAVSSAYADQADDLEDRAVRAMRRAITTEADRIKDVIEHSVQVKKREVRLSLLVLVTASLVYLALYWFTSRPAS